MPVQVGVDGILFFRSESRAPNAFVDFELFRNPTYAGATLSNLLLNRVAGMLTLGYAIAIVAFIRVGERLLQEVGARAPMIWGRPSTDAASSSLPDDQAGSGCCGIYRMAPSLGASFGAAISAAIFTALSADDGAAGGVAPADVAETRGRRRIRRQR